MRLLMLVSPAAPGDAGIYRGAGSRAEHLQTPSVEEQMRVTISTATTLVAALGFAIPITHGGRRQGARARRRLLDRVATDRLRVQGFHLPFPSVSHAVREGNAYRWLPDA
jgi:hypothetical protein